MMLLLSIADLRRSKRNITLPFRFSLGAVTLPQEIEVLAIHRLLPGKRLTAKALWCGHNVLIKLFFERNAYKRHWHREASGLAALLKAGIATPRILAQAENRKQHAALLITEYLSDAQTLTDLCATQPQEAIAAALTVLGRMHEAGLEQRDIHPGNFLWAAGKIYSIDGDGILAQRGPLPTQRAIHNLALFLAQFSPDHIEELAPLVHYPAGASIKADALDHCVRQQRNARWLAYRQKLLRDCTEIRCKQRWSSFLAVRREFDDADMRDLLAKPEQYLAGAERLKDGNSSTVVLVHLPNRSVVVKRYNIKNWRHRLSRCWRPTRALHSWINAHCLKFFGIATPQPMAFLEQRFGPLRGTAYFISEYLSGDNLITRLKSKVVKKVMVPVALMFSRLRQAQLAHGDMKASNILCHQDQPYLLDLDAMVWISKQQRFLKCYQRDRERFLANWEKLSPIRLWFDAHLSHGLYPERLTRQKRLLFISKGAKDAATRYRCSQYFPLWEAHGWQLRHMDAASKLRMLWAARQSDVVIVCRKMFPALWLRLLRWVSPILIFDFDDALFSYSDGKPSATRRKRFAGMIRACDHVFAGNAYLADEARQYNANVSVVPTAIDIMRYPLGIADDNPAYLDLVWIGSRSTRKYLEFILPILEQAAESIPQLRLKIISDFTLQSEKLPILALPWSQDSEAVALAASHIGIAPMWDDAWTRGKCALKVLQYMAAGLPVVSSNVGANSEAVEAGVSGYLVENSAEAWLKALSTLANDAELRRRMGEHGRQAVINRYDKNAVFAGMAAVLGDTP